MNIKRLMFTTCLLIFLLNSCSDESYLINGKKSDKNRIDLTGHNFIVRFSTFAVVKIGIIDIFFISKVLQVTLLLPSPGLPEHITHKY